jgi:type I restriction enzyme, S subunit
MPGPQVDRDYLFHVLRQDTLVAKAASLATGINLPRISPKTLETFEIPLPPIGEQRRIVAILDHADRLRRKRTKAIEQLDRLALSYFDQLFTGKNDRSSLPIAQLGTLCELVRGSSPRPQGDPRFFGGVVPRLMIADITRDGMMVTPAIDSLTEEGAKRSRPMFAGSVVMTVSGAVGLPAILSVDACIHDGFVGFRRLDNRLKPEFLYYWLLSQQNNSRDKGTGAIWVNLTTDQVSEFEIPLPSSRLQESFVALLTEVALMRGRYCAHMASLESLFASLQNSAFRGEVGSRQCAPKLEYLAAAS